MDREIYEEYDSDYEYASSYPTDHSVTVTFNAPPPPPTTAMPEQPAPTIPDIWSALRARHNNAVRLWDHTNFNPNHDSGDIFDTTELKNTEYEPYISAFEGISTSHAYRQMRQLDKDLVNQRVLDATPWWKEVPLSVAASLTDPSEWIAGAAGVGAAAVVGAAMVPLGASAAAIGVTALVAELMASGYASWSFTNYAREKTSLIDPKAGWDELFINTMVGWSIGRGIGYGYDTIKTVGRQNAAKVISRLWEAPLTQRARTSTEDLLKQTGLVEQYTNMASYMDLQGEKVSNLIKRFGVGTLGVFSPANRVAVRGGAAAQKALVDMKVVDLVSGVNYTGTVSPIALESKVFRAQNERLNKFDAIYKAGWKESGINKLNDYNRAFAEAHINNGEHANAGVSKASKKVIADLQNDVQKGLLDTNLLGEGALPNAEQYYPQLYDRAKIFNVDDTLKSEFLDKITNYIRAGTIDARVEKPRLAQQIRELQKEKLDFAVEDILQRRRRADTAIKKGSTEEAGQIFQLAKRRVKDLKEQFQKAKKESISSAEMRQIRNELGDTMREVNALRKTAANLNPNVKSRVSSLFQGRNIKKLAKLQLQEIDATTRVTEARVQLKEARAKFFEWNKGLVKGKDRKAFIEAHKADYAKKVASYENTLEKVTKRRAEIKGELRAARDLVNKKSAMTRAIERTRLQEIAQKLRPLKQQYNQAIKYAAVKDKDIPLYSAKLATEIGSGGKVTGDLHVPIKGSAGSRTYKKARVITIPQTELLDFSDTDFYKVYRRYLTRTTADIETAKVFGKQLTFEGSSQHTAILAEQNQMIAANLRGAPKIMRDYARTSDDLSGMLLRIRGVPIAKYATPDSWYKDFLKFQRSLVSSAVMGAAWLSMVPDLATATMVGGFSLVLRQAWPANFIGHTAKLSKKELKSLNLGANNALRGLAGHGLIDTMNDVSSTPVLRSMTRFTDWIGNVQRKMTGVNLMDNLRMQLLGSAVQAKVGFLTRDALNGKLKPKNMAFLRSLGISDQQAIDIGKMASIHGEVKNGYMGVDLWGDRKLADLYTDALNMFLIKRSTSVSKVDLPFLYESSFAQSALQFMSWIPPLINKVIIPGIADHRSEFAQTVVGMLGLGFLASYTKHLLNPDPDKKEPTFTEWAKRSVNASGLPAWPLEMKGRIQNFSEGIERNNLRQTARALGTTAGTVADLTIVAKSIPDLLNPSKSLSDQEKNAWYNITPLHNVVGLDRLITRPTRRRRSNAGR